MAQVPSSIVALEVEQEKIKTTALELLLDEARKNRLLMTALLLHTLENSDVRSKLLKEKLFRKHVLTLDELRQSADRERQLLRCLSRLPEPLRQFLIYHAILDETAFPPGLRNILDKPTVHQWLNQWAKKDPAWETFIHWVTSSERNLSERVESPYELSPYGLTTFPLSAMLHFVFTIRHRVTGDSVMVYAQTVWNQSVLQFYVRRIPEGGLTGHRDLFREEASIQDWLAVFLFHFRDIIENSIAIDPLILGDYFLLAHSWGPSHIFSRALKRVEVANWPFQARTYRDTLIPVMTRASDPITRQISKYPALLQQIETSPLTKEVALTRSKIHLQYPLFLVLSSAARATLSNTSYVQFIMWLDHALPKEQKPPWFLEFTRHDLRKPSVITASTIPSWGKETARALLDGWIWFLSLKDQRIENLTILQEQVRENLDFLTLIQPSEIFELLRAMQTPRFMQRKFMTS